MFFAFQFIAIARFAPEADSLKLSAIQFVTVSVIAGIFVLLTGEIWTFRDIVRAGFPLIYCGIIAIGVACTVQVAAQKYVHPATASIVLSTASVFAVIWGWMLLGEKYSARNLTGCALIFAAVLLVQYRSNRREQ